MAVEIRELFTSQKGGIGADGSMDLTYVVTGTATLADVITIVNATAPATWDSKFIGPSPDVEYVGPNIWIVAVHYGPLDNKQRTTSTASEYSFEIGTATEHVDVSLATYGSYGTNPPDYKQLVNVSTKDGKLSVGGADILKPHYEFGQSKIYSDAYLTTAKKLAWANMVATLNAAAFQGMEASSVIYLGCSGNKRGRGDWEVTHRFGYSKNRTAVTIGAITGIEVGGWEYLWVVFDEEEDATAKVVKAVPKWVYVEQMYEQTDFSAFDL